MMLRLLKVAKTRVTVSRDEQTNGDFFDLTLLKQTAGSCNQEGNKVSVIARLPIVKLRWFNV